MIKRQQVTLDQDWFRMLKGTMRFDEPLAKHTSFKIGGVARAWYEPLNQNDLVACLRILREKRIPYYVIGNGTNVLFDDKGFGGVIIKLSSGSFKQIERKGNQWRVGAGVAVPVLVHALQKTAYGGYEFLVGIPGTIGGALITNAGITFDGKRYNIGDIVSSVTAIDKTGRLRTITARKAGFRYRNSKLNKFIILGACLTMKKTNRQASQALAKTFTQHRAKLHRCPWPNAGCIFKNPSRYLGAGALIDRAGLKGKRCGGAMVSPHHANYIVNTGRARARDILRLIEIIKKKVYDTFAIRLYEEIKIVPHGN